MSHILWRFLGLGSDSEGRGPAFTVLPLQAAIGAHSIQRDPEVFLLAKCFLGGLGYQDKKPHILRKIMVFVGPAAEGGKANKPLGS